MPPALYSPIKTNKPRLRVGVLLDSWMAPAWIADILQSIQQSDIAEINAVILNLDPPSSSRNYQDGSWQVPGQVALKHLLWKLYLQFDTGWHQDFTAPFKPTDVTPIVLGATVINVQPIRECFVNRFPDAACAAICAERLDVLLHFGFNILRGEILTAARHGVWSYHHGDSDEYRGGPPGFWEMYERNPLTGVDLHVLTDEPDAGRVMYRSYGATSSYESLLINRYWMYRKAVSFVVRCLRRLHSTGVLSVAPPKRACNRRHYHTPGNLRMLIFMTRVVRKMIIARIQDHLDIIRDHWFVAYGWGVHRTITAGNCQGMMTISAPKGKSWADPMVVKKDGTNHVFLEELDYRSDRGRIVVVAIDASGVRGEAQVAIEADHHLSYPFVFEWNGGHYMIPETTSVRAVKLFRALEFPTRWEFVKDLLTDVSAADATVVEHDKRWYLFASVSESGGSHSDELFLFHADSLLGPWAPHPMNPLVSDVRNARPAGALFVSGSKLFRPAQNGAVSYGHAISVNEVTSLTTTITRNASPTR